MSPQPIERAEGVKTMDRETKSHLIYEPQIQSHDCKVWGCVSPEADAHFNYCKCLGPLLRWALGGVKG